MKHKLTSRKFLTAVTGLITGIILIISGETTEGVTAVVSSVIAYCITEGYIDANKFNNRLENSLSVKENDDDIVL